MITVELLLPWLHTVSEVLSKGGEMGVVSLVIEALVEGVREVCGMRVIDEVGRIVTALFGESNLHTHTQKHIVEVKILVFGITKSQ